MTGMIEIKVSVSIQVSFLVTMFHFCCNNKHACLSRFGFRTEEPNSASRNGLPERCFAGGSCRAPGACWAACTSSRPACLDSTTHSHFLTFPICPRCYPLGLTLATRARSAGAHAPVSPHRRRPSMMTGTVR